MANTYSITGWEGFKQTKATRVGEWVRRYNKQIFPLYSSFKDGAQGKTVTVDNRQIIFSGYKIWVALIIFVAVAIWSTRMVFRFFKREQVTPVAVKAPQMASGASGGPSDSNPSLAPVKSRNASFSEVWRITGSVNISGVTMVVVTNAAGAVRLESASSFSNYGLAQVGQVDGERVTSWSGATPVRTGAPAPAPLGTTVSKAVEVKK